MTNHVNLGWGWNEENTPENKELIKECLKKHIINYGAVYSRIFSRNVIKHNNNIVYTGDDFDENGSPIRNHAVSIIGWDDNYPKENFPENSRPQNNGAYLVLNSWGKQMSEDGCFWVSYENEYFTRLLMGVISVEIIEGNDQYIEESHNKFWERQKRVRVK